MKAIILFILFAMLTISSVFGQIKIGDNPQNIDAASILELESNTKVFVITRVTTLEMEAITPQRGGMVYNIDTECINYYDGTQWVNLCDAVDFNITNDPIVNNRVTIEITPTAAGYNLEIAKNGILGDNIVDGGIGPDDIQDNSIGQSKLAAESVGSSEIRSNAVGSDEIRDGSIAPSDMANFIPGQVLTTDENGIVQWEATGNLQGALGDEFTISGNGTPASPLQISEGVQQNISNNNSLITAHIVADEDTDDTNELIDLSFTKLTNTLSISKSANPIGASVDLSGLIGSDDQQLTLNNNILSLEEGGTPIDLSIYANSGSDNQNLETATLANEQLTITIEGGNPTTADLGVFATDAALTTGLALKEDLANKSNNVTLGNSTVLYPTQNAVKVYVDNVVGGSAQTIVSADPNNAIIQSANDGGAYYNDGDRNSQNELQDLAFNNATNILTLTTPGTPNNQADLSGLAGITTLNNGFILVGNAANAPAEVSVSGDATMNNLGEVTIENAAVTPIKIEPGLDGQFLSTVAGAVTWVAEPTGTGGSTELVDGITITGDGTNLDRFKIEPSATLGQYLRTNAAGNVVWDNLPTGTAGTVTSDGITIVGDGLATALQVPTGGITSLQIFDETIATADIADDNVTPDKIEQGAAGEVLTTDINGDVIWAPNNNLDNQNASEVPFTPAGNTVSTNVQAAITELQTEIDGITITGEANTASNQGTAGVGTFIQKNGVDLEFRSVNAGSNKITISEDAVNNEILVDIDDTNLTIIESQISDLTHTIDTDDQNAADVPFTPAGNTISTDVQAAITELQTEIDGMTAGNNFSNADLTLDANRTHQLAGFDLNFDGSGNIGIGNNNPQNKLHVSGEIRSEGYNSSQGTALLPAYSFSTGDDINTGMYRPAADEIGFSVGGIEALRVEEDGGNTNVIVYQSLQLNNLLLDKDGEAGTTGQILSSTGAQTDWIDAPTNTSADWNTLSNIPVG
ncbi:beta strand repeat-containing protein, partial [Maribacter hydrothermalis]|uniref:beta strand repeat-containing protein n=2 Tax=Maribacter hydrothermalis TaxID=1836467 RepID=UPI000A85C01F